jgi:hypothetical protein
MRCFSRFIFEVSAGYSSRKIQLNLIFTIIKTMAISEQQRQKKLAKKKQKRASIVSKISPPSAMDKASAYAKYPIHECMIPDNLFESGIGEVVVARRISPNNIAMAAFVVDVFCLGIKNALFKVLSEQDYEIFKFNFSEKTGTTFEKLHLTCAKKLIDWALAYAKDLGFNAHPDYKNAKDIFGDIEANACPVGYCFGKDGKPFYIRGPYEDQVKAQRIINTLQ